jgi:hypothetical protein
LPSPANNPQPSERQDPASLGDQRDLRFRHDVTRLHRLGPRILYQALCEFGETRLCRFELEELISRYAELDPELVRVLGADRWRPLPPLRAVPVSATAELPR